MATKSAATKTVLAKSKVVRPGTATPQKESEAPEKEGTETPDAPLPVLDLSDAAVKKMIKQAKKRGYVTYEQLNAVMPSEEVTSEKIEDVLAMMSEMGINVVETEEADSEDEEEAREEPAEDDEPEGGELVETSSKAVTKSEAKEPAERTDDPVRMYLREMGSVELLSREGEIAIAKRIEAGREMMIGGICENPMTIRAIVAWRDALNEGKMLLRDIIDLDATYGSGVFGPVPAEVVVVALDGGRIEGEGGDGAPNGAEPSESADAANGEDVSKDLAEIESELAVEEAESEESSISLAAMEAQLKPSALAIFDAIAETYKKLHRLQDQRINALQKADELPRATERRYEKLKAAMIENVKRVRLNNTRIEHLVEQLYDVNRRLVADEGRLLRLAESAGVKRPEFLQHYFGNELAANWPHRVGILSGRGWVRLIERHEADVAKLRAAIAQIANEAKLPISEFRRVVQT